MPSSQGSTRPTRRTVVKGAAWAVPAVTIAVAAPSIAASEPPIVPSFTPGTFCKHPGNPKYYHAVFCFDNTTDESITIFVDDLNINGIVRDATFSLANTTSQSYAVPANTKVCLYVDAGLYDNSANGSAILSFHYDYLGDHISDTVSGGTIADGSLPPCGTGSAASQPNDNPPHPTSGPGLP